MMPGGTYTPYIEGLTLFYAAYLPWLSPFLLSDIMSLTGNKPISNRRQRRQQACEACKAQKVGRFTA